jgi:hypothetical protein
MYYDTRCLSVTHVYFTDLDMASDQQQAAQPFSKYINKYMSIDA